MKSLLLFPYTFVLMNWAAVVGLYHFLRGQHDVWAGYAVVHSVPEEMQAPQGAAINKTAFSDAA